MDIEESKIIAFGPLENPEMTIEEARDGLYTAGLNKGASCPCCGQFVKFWVRKMNSAMAASLIWLVRTVNLYEGQYIHVPTMAPKWIINSRDFPKLRYWGFIQEKFNEDSKKRCSGFWKHTEPGKQFSLGKIPTNESLVIYNNRVLASSEEFTTVRQSLGSHFDYEELWDRSANWTLIRPR